MNLLKSISAWVIAFSIALFGLPITSGAQEWDPYFAATAQQQWHVAQGDIMMRLYSGQGWRVMDTTLEIKVNPTTFVGSNVSITFERGWP